MKNLLSLYVANRRIVILTFEIFWIAVFIIERLTSVKAGQIPQFQYVNF